MDASHWPWWLGAAALAAIAVSYTAAVGRPLGVSGLISRVLGGRTERPAAGLFLVGVTAGGALAAVTSGGIELASLSTTFQRFFGDGAGAFAALLGGGFLVGVGTTLAGGCTSGHGLMGCARLQPGSLVATAAFFGTAVAVSFVLSWVTT
jgi:uncharacterized membrane protein YedE/YeeE